MMSAPAPYPTVQSSAPAIDDHEITTRTPSICVDYLSHNWTDEDVWSSWKAMTKRKNEIANGVRLENASWRTWAKQRGKLKTISPETLNWLKDSDVTWLYGPLHEHADPVPPPRQATARERLGLEDVSNRTKSILKHRTISEMLTTPGLNAASPSAETPPALGSGANSRDGSDDEGGENIVGGQNSSLAPSKDHSSNKMAIHFTKSETALSKMNKRTAGSPTASERLMRNMSLGDKNEGIPIHEERRHISFNQRVDQCIAVDAHEEYEDEDDEDYSDGNYEMGRRDDEEGSSSDEEVLTMKSSPRTAATWSTITSGRNSSPGLEHQTIAKLAPTILKTSDTYPAPSPQVVDPSGFTAHFNGTDVAGGDVEPHLSAQPQLYQYDSADEELTQTRYSQWDADDDFNGDFDYFNGPDVHDSYHSQGAAHSVQGGGEEDGNKMNSDNLNPASSNHVNESSSPRPGDAPKSILKRRPATANEQHIEQQEEQQLQGSQHFSPPSSPEMTQSPPSGSNLGGKERGRTSQRVGSSASYERLQDAARGTVLGSNSNSGSRTRSSSSNGSVQENDLPSSSSSPPSTGSLNNAKNQSDRRESFRGKAGDGARAMDGSKGNSNRKDGSAFEIDSDGRASFDFNSPGYPASPLLGDKDGDSDSNDEAKLYGNKKDSSRWADSRSSNKQQQQTTRRTSGTSKLAGSSNNHSGRMMSDEEEEQEELEDERDPSTRLSVDLENLPSNAISPPGSAQGGPTPLNTPTFALARSRSGTKKSGKTTTTSGGMTNSGGPSSSSKHGKDNSGSTGGGGGSGASSNDDWEGREPESPTMPRRSSATGALVAPSDADKVAGVRVPLAHDYVEEDEGGIVGRAVEIVNTARDLIGALLGTGGDRGRSWREAN